MVMLVNNRGAATNTQSPQESPLARLTTPAGYRPHEDGGAVPATAVVPGAVIKQTKPEPGVSLYEQQPQAPGYTYIRVGDAGCELSRTSPRPINLHADQLLVSSPRHFVPKGGGAAVPVNHYTSNPENN